MYVFDIDGTVANISHRLHYIESKPKDWNAFYEACDADSVILPVVLLARNLLKQGHDVAYLTGRPERLRDKTTLWLSHNYLWHGAVGLYMRANNDKRLDSIVKPELIKQLPFPASVIFEDRSSVVKKWRELGYTCFQVADGNF